MKLIDVNVVIYALESPHEYRDSCRRIMAGIRSGALSATVNTETLQELLHYYHRRRSTELALSRFDDLTAVLPPALPVDDQTARLARELLGHYSTVDVRDAFHAATVFQYDLEGIISADRGFDAIQGLTRFDPKELAA